MNESKRRASYEDLESVPPNCVGEIVDGELYVSPRPALPHLRVTFRLRTLLGGRFDLGGEGPEGWLMLREPELHLGDDVLVPDLTGWRRERMPDMPDTEAFTLTPDWVCEVVSPATEVLDREKKMNAYARGGVSHLWLVDPLHRLLEVYLLTGRSWRLWGCWSSGIPLHAEPFAELPLELGRLWAR